MKIETFFKGIQGIENKNGGGCLFFGYAFFLWLDKEGYDKRSFDIVQYADENLPEPFTPESSTNNMAFINGEGEKAESSTHFSWLYRGKEYDANGELTVERKANMRLQRYQRTVLNGLTLNEGVAHRFFQACLNNGEWATTFDRNMAIAAVRENFGIDMSSVRLPAQPAS